MPPKQYAVIENLLKASVDAEIAHRATQKGQAQNKAAQEAKEEAEGELVELKRRGQLSYQNLINGNIEKSFQSSKAKDLLKEFAVKAAEAIEEHSVTNIKNWWSKRLQHALPKKAKENGRGKRKIGEVTSLVANSAEGTAIENALKSAGLLTEFEEGELTLLMNAVNAITSAEEGFSNKCYVFSSDMKKAIALAKCKERNQLVATIQDDGQGPNAVTNGMELEDYIETYGSVDGLALLEEQLRKQAKERARSRGIDDDNTIHAAGSLTFVTGAKIIADFFNIQKALDHPNVCAAKDKKGGWRILACGEKKMKKQNCVGSVIANGCEYDDFEKMLDNCECILVELWASSEEVLVVDANAKKDPSSSSDDPRYKKIKLAGTDRYIRRSTITEDTSQRLTTFQCKLGGNSENKVRHHRLVAIFEHHFGWGFNQTPLIMEYLGLKDGESFEDHERFKYHQGLSDASIRNRLRREEYLKRRKWDERKLAKWSDVDHLLGRSKRWKNSNFFTMHVSHSWNQAMSYLRICYGDWLYGFANIQYHSGSD